MSITDNFSANRIGSIYLRTIDWQPSLSPDRNFSNRAAAGQYKLAKNRERKTFELESLTICEEKQFCRGSTMQLATAKSTGNRLFVAG